MSGQIKASKVNWKAVALWLIVGWVAVTVFVYFISTRFNDLETAGQIGDMFGAVNALFSGVAIIGLVYTILLQREDIGIQREELRLTRDEHKKSAVALARQAESLKQAARISAITTLVNSINTRVKELTREHPEFYPLEHKRTRLLEELEEIYDGKSPDSNIE